MGKLQRHSRNRGAQLHESIPPPQVVLACNIQGQGSVSANLLKTILFAVSITGQATVAGELDVVSAAPAPTVSSITNDVGDTAGGVPVTITGVDFTGATGATLGGVALTSFLVVNDTTITGVTGARAKGVVDVAVTGPGGTGTLTNGYEYWNPTATTSVTCILWLRGDLGTTVNGSNQVTAWNDQSGIGDANRNFTLANPPNAPAYNATDATYNNKSTVGTFNIAGDLRFKNPAAWNATYNTFTIGIVGHADNTTNRYFTYGTTSRYTALINGAGNPRIYINDASTGNHTIGGGSGLDTAKCLFMAEVNGASSKLFLDSTATADVSGVLDATTLGDYVLSVGGHPSVSGVERLAELFAWNGVLSAGERVKLRKYLNGRYNKSIAN